MNIKLFLVCMTLPIVSQAMQEVPSYKFAKSPCEELWDKFTNWFEEEPVPHMAIIDLITKKHSEYDKFFNSAQEIFCKTKLDKGMPIACVVYFDLKKKKSQICYSGYYAKHPNLTSKGMNLCFEIVPFFLIEHAKQGNQIILSIEKELKLVICDQKFLNNDTFEKAVTNYKKRYGIKDKKA